LREAEKYLGFDDRWMMALGIPFVTFIVLIMIFGTETLMCNPIPCSLIAFIHATAYWFTFRWVLINYHKSFPDYKFTPQRLSYIVSRLIVAYLLLKFSVGLTVTMLFPEKAEFYDANKLSYFISEITEIILIALIFFIYEGIYYFNKSRMIEIEKNKLQKITAEQKLDTLKNQVNPHFLFNSLNTLVTMIPEEPELAINFVQKLSTTYRNILEVRDEKLITISQELKALDSYIFLLETRFQDKINVENKLESGILEKFILPLSLQILIENAVKHNITSTNKPLTITITEQDNYIVVSNNLQKKNQQYNSTKMGLANIRSRYRLLIHQDIVVNETKESFIVKLPIIENISR